MRSLGKLRNLRKTKKTKNITFPLTENQYEQIEKAALASDDDPNNWRRKTTLSWSEQGHALTKNEGLIYQEIALVRFLLGTGSNCCSQRSNGCNLEKAHRPGRPEIGGRSSASYCLGEGQERSDNLSQQPGERLGCHFCLPAFKVLVQVLPRLGTKMNRFPVAFGSV